MGEATFSVSKVQPPECDALDCFRPAALEVALIGSSVPHHEVCRFHKTWAKQRLVERDIERRQRLNLCIRCGLPDDGTVDSCDCTPAEKIASGQ